jgi:hypothetical protein
MVMGTYKIAAKNPGMDRQPGDRQQTGASTAAVVSRAVSGTIRAAGTAAANKEAGTTTTSIKAAARVASVSSG